MFKIVTIKNASAFVSVVNASWTAKAEMRNAI